MKLNVHKYSNLETYEQKYTNTDIINNRQKICRDTNNIKLNFEIRHLKIDANGSIVHDYHGNIVNLSGIVFPCISDFFSRCFMYYLTRLIQSSRDSFYRSLL